LNPRLAKVAPGTQGAIAELKVAAYLAERGYAVFRAVSPNSLCDLIVWKDGKAQRIEVKTGQILATGGISATYPKPGRYFDILAVVLPNEIRFTPTL
jgi:hypothetical protein